MGAKRRGSEANLEQRGDASKQKKTARTSPAKKEPTPSNKLYKDTLKKVDKVFNALVKKYSANPTEWSGVTADTFATSMEAAFLPIVKSLSATSPVIAFNLLMDIGEHAYGDLDASAKASGFGETEEPYKRMDDQMVEIINARREADGTDADGTNVSAAKPYAVEPSYSDLGGDESALRSLWGKKHPNIQQRKQLDRARLADLKAMFNARRERRDAAQDWAGNALNDLVETGGRIGEYGIDTHFFQKSVGLLALIKGVERPVFAEPPKRPVDFK
ncbi:hypothetical protein F4818DRAFT_414563 [Hypoxylon cercidicola]|nr:hypothetical protein F4818DRAFT_414563 [Hypoxylon cercidicola]